MSIREKAGGERDRETDRHFALREILKTTTGSLNNGSFY